MNIVEVAVIVLAVFVLELIAYLVFKWQFPPQITVREISLLIGTAAQFVFVLVLAAQYMARRNRNRSEEEK